MIKSLSAALISLFLVCLASSQVGYAAEAERQLASVLTVKVKPGGQANYTEFIQKLAEAHNKLGTDVYWYAFSGTFGEPSVLTFARLFTSWGEIAPNDRQILVEAFGPAEATRLQALVAASGEIVDRAVYVQRPDLSNLPPADAPATTYSLVYSIEIKAGTGPKFEEWLSKLAQATAEIGGFRPASIWSPSFGGNNRYAVFLPLQDWSELDTPVGMTLIQRVEKVFGKREAKRLAALRDEALVSVESNIRRFLPDLSRPVPQ
jgi:hypothetical protein